MNPVAVVILILFMFVLCAAVAIATDVMTGGAISRILMLIGG